jgi:hypothetical protein
LPVSLEVLLDILSEFPQPVAVRHGGDALRALASPSPHGRRVHLRRGRCPAGEAHLGSALDD